jgi:hypothetical protein
MILQVWDPAERSLCVSFATSGVRRVSRTNSFFPHVDEHRRGIVFNRRKPLVSTLVRATRRTCHRLVDVGNAAAGFILTPA